MLNSIVITQQMVNHFAFILFWASVCMVALAFFIGVIYDLAPKIKKRWNNYRSEARIKRIERNANVIKRNIHPFGSPPPDRHKCSKCGHEEKHYKRRYNAGGGLL